MQGAGVIHIFSSDYRRVLQRVYQFRFYDGAQITLFSPVKNRMNVYLRKDGRRRKKDTGKDLKEKNSTYPGIPERVNVYMINVLQKLLPNIVFSLTPS